jgi:PAS domain-containing protein
MTNTIDPVPYWTREIEQLRAQVVKNRRRSDPCALGDVAEHALMVCDTLLQELSGAGLECERLRAEARAETAAWERLFYVMPGACLLTDGASAILTANRAAGTLLNVSAKHLKDRPLLLFAADREKFHALLQDLPLRGHGEHRSVLTIRPKERKAAQMGILVVPLSSQQPDLWMWFLNPVGTEPHAHVASEVVQTAREAEPFVL